MPDCDGDHPAPPPKTPPPVQEGNPANSAGGAANATAATPFVPSCLPTPRRRRSPTPHRILDEDGPPDGRSEYDGSEIRSLPGSWPSYCLTECAPGDAPLSETVQGEILMLPDENPPTEYDYQKGVFFWRRRVRGGELRGRAGRAGAEGQNSGRGFRILAGELGPAGHESSDLQGPYVGRHQKRSGVVRLPTRSPPTVVSVPADAG